MTIINALSRVELKATLETTLTGKNTAKTEKSENTLKEGKKVLKRF